MNKRETLNRSFVAVSLLAWAASCVVAEKVIVHRVVYTAPKLAPAAAIFVLDETAINFTPTVIQGSSLTFTATGLPTGASINSTTGQITGTLSALGVSNVEVTATSNITGEEYLLPIRVHVYASSVTVDAAWKTANLQSNGSYRLTGANTLYDIQTDFTSVGTCLDVRANGVGIRGNNHTLSYDQATPITIADAGFEQVDDWDFASAANGSQFAGTFLSNTLYEGTYVLRFDCPTANNEYVVSDATITLEPNTTYSLTAMVHFGVNSNGTPLNNPGCIGYVELVGTGAETTIRAYNTRPDFDFLRGIQHVKASFTTGSGTPTYRVRAGVQNGSLSAGSDIYIDDVKVQRHGVYGIQVNRNIASASSLTVTNVNVIQGTDGATEAHGIYLNNQFDPWIDSCDLTVNGADCSCAFGADMLNSTSKDVGVVNNAFTSNVETISSRDNGDGAMVKGLYGSFMDNAFRNGPAVGLLPGGIPAGPSKIGRNYFQLLGKYTNNFAINGGAGQANTIFGNEIDSSTGSYNCRGIALQPTDICLDNIVSVQAVTNNQEYGGIQIGGSYATQKEITTGGTIEGNTYTVVGSGGGACLRFGPANSGTADSGLCSVTDCVCVMDLDANTLAIQGALIKTQNNDLDNWEINSSSLTTNATFYRAEGGDSFDNYPIGTLLITDCTIRYIDDGLAFDPCWVAAYKGRIRVTVENPTFHDAGTKTWMDSAPVNYGSGAEDTTAVSVIVQNDIAMRLTSGGTPIASSAVVIEDAAGTEVFNGSTDGSGNVAFIAKDFSRIDGVRTEHNPYTITINGFYPEAVDLDENDRSITVPMTAE